MKRALGWSSLAPWVVLGLVWLMSRPVHSQESPDTGSADTKPVKLKVETGKIVIETSLKGTVEAEQTSELFLDAKSWTGPFTVKSAAAHGTRVKKGDVVLELDTDKIDQAISDLQLERSLADITLRQAKDELPILEQFLPLNLAGADRDKRIAEEDLKRYTDIERDHTKKSADFLLKSQLQWLEYSKEELKQLQKMYRDKDLTEETEEIILKRQRNQIEQLEFNIESLKLSQDREALLDLPRRDQTMKDNLQKQTLAWQKAQSALPLELNQKRLALKKQEIERGRTEERFRHLEGDRAAMIVRAPQDGVVYHGQSDRGQWNTATVTNHLRRNGSIQPKEIFMTIVSIRPVILRADVEEKDLHLMKAGLMGQATPVGSPTMKLGARIQSFSLFPRAAGSFETKISLDVPDNVEAVMPGMTVNAKFVVYRNDTAVLVSTSAIFYDEGNEVPYVYIAGPGKPVKTQIEVGKTSGSKTEVVSGLKAGVEILASKP